MTKLCGHLFEVMEAREGRRATVIASQLEPNEWYLRIEGELMADSILNRIATGARYVDLDGPNMREYFAKRRAELQRYRRQLTAGTILSLLAVPTRMTVGTARGYYSVVLAAARIAEMILMPVLGGTLRMLPSVKDIFHKVPKEIAR